MLDAVEDLVRFAFGNFFVEPPPNVQLRQTGRPWHLGKVLLKKLVAGAGSGTAMDDVIDARRLRPEALAQGAHRGSMEELTRWTVEADKVVVF